VIVIVLDFVLMNMYYYSYSDDEHENEFVEDVMVYYDNEDEFVLSKKSFQIVMKNIEFTLFNRS